MMIVTAYPNQNEPQGKTIYLREWLKGYPKYNERIRAIRQTDDLVTRREMELQLPCIAPAGTFSEPTDKGLLKFSGLMLVKFTNLDIPTSLLKHIAIRENPYCWYIGETATGTGCFALVSVSRFALLEDNWAMYHKAVISYFGSVSQFADLYLAKISDRVFYSWDPDGLFNDQARERPFVIIPKKQQKAGG